MIASKENKQMKFRKMTDEQIDRAEKKREAEWPKNFKFGGFGSHELVDRTEIVMYMFQEYVVEHPTAQMSPVFNKLAQQIGCLMYDLYNMSAIADCTEEGKESWDLSHLDDISRNQIEQYDAVKALQEKWNDEFIDTSDQKSLLARAEKLKAKEKRALRKGKK